MVQRWLTQAGLAACRFQTLHASHKAVSLVSVCEQAAGSPVICCSTVQADHTQVPPLHGASLKQTGMDKHADDSQFVLFGVHLL